MKIRFPVLLFCLVLGMAGRNVCEGAQNTWIGSTNANWFKASNWSAGRIPTNGDTVVIDDLSSTATNVLLTNATRRLASLVITNRMITFSNWTTVLYASNVMLRNRGVFTLPAAFRTGMMSNRVSVVCTNLVLESGGRIDADRRGYAGYAEGPGGAGYGPGGGGLASGWGSGGGHGGMGGYPQGAAPSRGAANGTATQPNPGSGGGGGTSYGAGGHGGGLVHIDASNGTVLLNGTITANGGGGAGYPSGGGAGGGVRIVCGRIQAASTGIIRAIGGNGGSPADPRGGRGGGGRIAILYDRSLQAAVGVPGIRLSASGATNGATANGLADSGTTYIPDTRFLTRQVVGTDAIVYGVTNWALSSLTFTNCTWTLRGPGLRMLVTNALTVGANGFLKLYIENRRLDCADMVLMDGGRLAVYSGMTNGSTPSYGGFVSVSNGLAIGAGSWLYPYSDPVNGGSLLFSVGRLDITGTNGGIEATSCGYAPLKGPGTGASDGSGYGGGAGHGGKGGVGGNTGPAGGLPYGLTNGPVHAGSGGGGTYAPSAYGGGSIRISTSGKASLNGIVRANGGAGAGSGAGGGSGGSIWLRCASLYASSNARLEARGGNGWSNGGGGGGGRIAVWYGVPADRVNGILDNSNMMHVVVTNACEDFSGTMSVTNGTGFYNGPPNGAVPGTFVFLTVRFPGTVLLLQ